MGPQELQVWLARSVLHPSTSPDRWFAKITAALIKKPDHESLLPNCSRISTLRYTIRDIQQQLAANTAMLWESITKIFRVQ